MVPAVDGQMEGYPPYRSLNVPYLCLSEWMGIFVFIVVIGGIDVRFAREEMGCEKWEAKKFDDEFQELQTGQSKSVSSFMTTAPVH
jgi:hypothetical protein